MKMVIKFLIVLKDKAILIFCSKE